MNRSKARGPRERTLEEVAEAEDLRSAITAALAATPIDEHALRRGVWTYVSSERAIGTSPGDVIARLAAIVAASNAPRTSRKGVTHRVTLWCVEAYFGHLGGEAQVGGGTALTSSHGAMTGAGAI